MKWLQTRNIDGIYRRFVRFKCNRCGTTGELPDVAATAATPGPPLPGGWQAGPHAGSHLCPGCVTAPRKKLLPVLS